MMKIVAIVVVVGFAVVLANEHKNKNERPVGAGTGNGNGTHAGNHTEHAEHGHGQEHGHGRPHADKCGLKSNVDAKCPPEKNDRAKVGDCRKCLFEECRPLDPDCEAIKTCIDGSACKIQA